jgi:hypothetical protein
MRELSKMVWTKEKSKQYRSGSFLIVMKNSIYYAYKGETLIGTSPVLATMKRDVMMYIKGFR